MGKTVVITIKIRTAPPLYVQTDPPFILFRKTKVKKKLQREKTTSHEIPTREKSLIS